MQQSVGGVSEATLASRLAGLADTLRNEFSREIVASNQNLPSPTSPVLQQVAAGGTTVIYQSSPAAQRIDQLQNTTITNPAISGGTITGANISGGSVTATDFSGVLPVSEGGTSTSTAPSYGQLLVGNATGGYNLLATSSLGIVGGGSGSTFGQSFEIQNGYLAPTTTLTVLFPLGIIASASSTIANVSIGNSTTTNATSTTLYASSLTAGSATSTSLFASVGDITNAVINTLSASIANIVGLTATNATFTNSTTTNATSTNFAATNASTTKLSTGSLTLGSGTGVLYVAGGVVAPVANGADGLVLKLSGGLPTWATDQTGSGGGSTIFATTSDSLAAYLSPASTVLLVGASATSTTGNIFEVKGNSLFRGTATVYSTVTAPSFTATSTTVASQLPYASSTGFSSSYASSTSGFFGNLSIGNLSGFLKTTAGAISAALVDLASNVTGILPVGNGGTGWANLASGTVVLGNGTGAVSTTTRGNLSETGSSILTITGGANAILGAGTTIQVQQADGSHNGFLTSGDWTTFNGKQGALAFSYPLTNSANTISLAFGTTTSNTWAGTQTFGNVVATAASSTSIFANALSASAASFGSTATSTFNSSGALSLAGGLTLSGNPNGPLQANAGIVSATTTVGALYGGTGQTSVTTGDLLYGSATNAWSKLGIGTGGTVLASLNGVPTWVATSSINNGVSSIAQSSGSGQTGAITIATSSDTNLLLNVTNSGGTFTFAPAWTGTLAAGRLNSNVVQGVTNDTNVTGSISAQNLTLGWTGQLAVSRGGTGQSTFSSGQLLYGAGTGAVQSVATSTFTNGTGISVTGNGYAVGSSPTISFSAPASSALSIPYASSTAISSSYASSTSGLFGNLSIGNLSGFLKATAGAISTALVDLTSNVTGILQVGNGGTGRASLAAGAVPYGNGSSALSTTTAATGGQVLAFLNGIPMWTATTTFSSGLAYASGGVTNTGVLAVGPVGQTTTGTATFASSTTGTDFTITGSGSTITFNLPTASASNRGLLSSGDWTTFNNKSGTASPTFTGLATFANSSSSIASVYGPAYFGATATSSFSTAGALTLASALTEANGGTHQTTYTTGDILYASAANTLSKLAIATPGFVLALSNGIPTWVATTTLSNISGTLAVASGGTDATTASQARLNLATAASGANSDITSLSGLTTALSVAQGGTGWANINSGYIPFGNGASALSTSTNLFWDSMNSRLGVGTTSPWAQFSINPNGINSMAEFAIGSSTATHFFVGTNGNVGIGLTNPAVSLEVNGNIRAHTIVQADTFNNTANSANIIYRSGTNTIVGNNANALVVQDGGNVGIGGTPTTKLHVFKANTDALAASNATLLLDPGSLSSDTGASVGFGTGSWQFAAIKGASYAGGTYGGYLSFWTALDNSAWNERMRITKDGYVGIGLTGPTHLLQLNTDDGFKPNGGSWGNSSDARLKTNIAPVTDALSKLTQLQGVTYDWINPSLHGNATSTGGFIAQDVAKVFPDFVKQSDCTGTDCALVGSTTGKEYNSHSPLPSTPTSSRA